MCNVSAEFRHNANYATYYFTCCKALGIWILQHVDVIKDTEIV